MKRRSIFSVVLLMALLCCSCAAITPGATNTTVPNVGVTSYEALGLTLTQAYNTEKALFKAGKITAEQDKEFQLGVYTTAYNCYQKIGLSLNIIFDVKESATNKETAQLDFKTLSSQLPTLIGQVTAYITAVSK
jgi:hypothetical protein